jgi:hypothetical protein
MNIATDDIRKIRNLMKFTDFHIQMSIGDEVLPNAESLQKLRRFLEFPLSTFKNGDFFVGKHRHGGATITCQLFANTLTKIETIEDVQSFLSLAISLGKDGPGKSCFYAVFHLIDAGSLLDTLGLMQRLANSIDETTDEAATKAIFPICFKVLQLLAVEGMPEDERARVLQFVTVYGELLDLPDDAARFAALALERWPDLPKPGQQYRMLSVLINFMAGSRTLALDINGRPCNFAASLQTPDPLKPVSVLLNCSALFWRKDTRLNEASSVQAVSQTPHEHTARRRSCMDFIWCSMRSRIGCQRFSGLSSIGCAQS